MSANLEMLLDAERRADCARNDAAMRTMTHAHLMQTTRRYPRTTGEAFKDATYSSAIERPQPSLLDRFVSYIRSL